MSCVRTQIIIKNIDFALVLSFPMQQRFFRPQDGAQKDTNNSKEPLGAEERYLDTTRAQLAEEGYSDTTRAQP